MDKDAAISHSRMEIQQELKRINREIIHDLVPGLDITAMTPFFELVAKARGLYIKRLLEIANPRNDMPTDTQVRELNLLRRSYEELMSGSQIVEVAIERGYIDVK